MVEWETYQLGARVILITILVANFNWQHLLDPFRQDAKIFPDLRVLKLGPQLLSSINLVKVGRPRLEIRGRMD